MPISRSAPSLRRETSSTIETNVVTIVSSGICARYGIIASPVVESSSTNPPNVYGFGHEGYYRNVLAVLRGEARPETDGRAGRKSLELILGIYESDRMMREVLIPRRDESAGVR